MYIYIHIHLSNYLYPTIYIQLSLSNYLYPTICIYIHRPYSRQVTEQLLLSGSLHSHQLHSSPKVMAVFL